MTDHTTPPRDDSRDGSPFNSRDDSRDDAPYIGPVEKPTVFSVPGAR